MKIIALAVLSVVACAPPATDPVEVAASAHGIPADWLRAVAYQQSRYIADDAADAEAAMAAAADDAGMAGDVQLGDGIFGGGADDMLADTLVDEAAEGTTTDDDAAPAPLGTDVDRDGFGVMQLTDAQLARASELTGRPVDEIRDDLAANLDGAAALLSDGGDDLRTATAKLLGVGDDADATQLALGDLDESIANDFTDTEVARIAPGHYPPRQWIASPNHSSRLGYSIRYIVIHDIEGTMAGAINVFKSSANEASAHYIVRARDGHIVQMVHEGDNAWHAGHGWFNRHSIGIEHEGFAHRVKGGGFYNETQYAASAQLTCAIAKRNHIPIDRKHVFGHGNVPSSLSSHTLCSDASSVAGRCGGVSHHSDPGRYWRWKHYMKLVRDCVAAAS